MFDEAGCASALGGEAVGEGGGAVHLAESAGEVERVGEADGGGYIADGEGGVVEQACGAAHAQADEEVDGGLAVAGAEGGGEV